MIFEDVIGAYLDAKQHDETRSRVRDMYSLKRLQPHFSGRSVIDLRRVDIRKYVDVRRSEGVTVSTVRRELRLFCAAINFVRLEFDRPDLPNPVASLGLQEPEGRVRYLTREEAARLIAAADQFSTRPHLAAFIRLALNTGCRKGELLNLEWSRVDLDRRLILLQAKDNKSKRRRTIPLNDDAVGVLIKLQDWQGNHAPGTPWVFGRDSGRKITTFKTAWTGALKRAGIEDFRIHDLRHTFASWLVMQGESLYVVKELLGHSSIIVTERYAHLAPQQTASAVQRMLRF